MSNLVSSNYGLLNSGIIAVAMGKLMMRLVARSMEVGGRMLVYAADQGEDETYGSNLWNRMVDEPSELVRGEEGRFYTCG